jgi:dimethylhistidine N-methyltransferase
MKLRRACGQKRSSHVLFAQKTGVDMPKPSAAPKPIESRAEQFGAARESARAEIAAGLRMQPARLSPKYFYNALGSKLFEAICLLDEYYLTRAEAGIFARFGGQIAAAAGQGVTLIDLGAGNCAKAAALFEVLRPQQYVPVDISVTFLQAAVAKLRMAHRDVPMLPVGLDFAESLRLPSEVRGSRRLFFYPGSSIGNFTPLQAAQFLTRVRGEAGADGGLLIGVDLVKDAGVLEAAYDDALGVTAAFNLNALPHANELLGSDFDVRDWRHVAFYNAEQNRIEMHLEAKRELVASWPGGARRFAAGERIHTENSYKYSKRGFVELLESCGFGEVTCFTDAHEKFLVCHARAL